MRGIVAFMENAFLVSAALIFVAELGDKSQLMALAFATKYRFWPTVTGIFLATLLVHAGSVLIGRVAAAALPVGPINIVAGLAYLAFAVWTIRGDELGEDNEERARRNGRWAVLAIATAFFLAELGDKTMLATVTLATTNEPIGTWLGSTVGMVAADALAVGAGAVLASRVSGRWVKVLAVSSFVIFGLLLIRDGLGQI
jgi:putative Ca2+/H+ antiporter (TMEM165/GDT1 family)